MRETLIDLIVSADISLFGSDKPYAEVYADYLLENGGIVLPCKIGDVVYRILYGRIYKIKIVEISIFMRDEQYFFEFFCYGGLSFSSYDVKKTVFLTREEAEQALKEGVQ